MKVDIYPLARLIAQHGADIRVVATPEINREKPWQTETGTQSEITVKGLIQQLSPLTDSDLPHGSIKGIVVMILPASNALPLPGNKVYALDRRWSIETIMPISRHRGMALVEAVLISSGTST